MFLFTINTYILVLINVIFTKNSMKFAGNNINDGTAKTNMHKLNI